MRAAVFQGCSSDSGTWQAAEGLRVAEQMGACSVLQKHRHPGRGAPPSRCLLSSLCIYFYLSGTKDKKEEVRPIGTEVKPCSKALEHFWNRVEHWNSGEGLPWATDPRGEGLSRSRSAAGLRPHESRPKTGRPGAGRRRIEQRPQLLRPA
jgi:hypothetical protein